MTSEATTEVWTSAGQVRVNGEKLAHSWLDPDGAELLYKGASMRAPAGGQYEVSVHRHDGKVTVSGRPSYIGLHPDADLRARLAATSRRDEALVAGRKRAAKEGDEIGRLCAPLRDLMAAERTAAGRRALLAVILDELRA